MRRLLQCQPCWRGVLLVMACGAEPTAKTKINVAYEGVSSLDERVAALDERVAAVEAKGEPAPASVSAYREVYATCKEAFAAMPARRLCGRS